MPQKLICGNLWLKRYKNLWLKMLQSLVFGAAHEVCHALGVEFHAHGTEIVVDSVEAEGESGSNLFCRESLDDESKHLPFLRVSGAMNSGASLRFSAASALIYCPPPATARIPRFISSVFVSSNIKNITSRAIFTSHGRVSKVLAESSTIADE